MLSIEEILPLLSPSKKVLITCHYKPDGDAMGSTLGLYHYLLQKGLFPTVVIPSACPDFLQWLPGIEQVLNFESEPKSCKKVLEEADFIFCLDFNTLYRVQGFQKDLEAAKQPKILIDHHEQPQTEAFAYGISRPQKSSTCEMVYDFICLDKGQNFLSQEVIQCLYTGTMTDTGSFRFPTTSASVHRMVADFKDRGLDHAVIHDRVFDVWSENRMRLLGYLLVEKMQVFPKEKVGIICLTQQEGERFHMVSGDTEGVVNYPLSILGMVCSVLLIERKDGIKLSFRSKGALDVSSIARDYFEGGGHFNAAGGRSSDSMEITLKRVKEVLHIQS